MNETDEKLKRNCIACHFFVDMSGTYEGRSWCRERYSVRTKGKCVFIDKKDTKLINIYLLKQDVDKYYRKMVKMTKIMENIKDKLDLI